MSKDPENAAFVRALRNAPRFTVGRVTFVDLAFIFPGLTDPLYWPLRELRAGFLPPEVTRQ